MPLFPRRPSLPETAAQALRQGLEAGLWRECLPGERVLCQQFQISRPTLRAALRLLEMEHRIEVTQGRARRILTPQKAGGPILRRQTIGLLSPVPLQALPPFGLFWIDEVRADLAQAGFQIEFHESRACQTRHPERALTSLLNHTTVSAWMLMLSTEPVQRWFRDRQVPCLVAGSCAAGIALPSVDVAYRAACRHAVGVFHRRGHTRLALVLPDAGYPGDADSEAGFREATASGPPPLVLRHDGTRENIIARLEAALGLAAPPTGFLVARSAHVLTVLTFLMRRGLRLPQDAAVISRDDDAFLDFVTPRVARYNNNPRQFARRVSNVVLQMARSGAFLPAKYG